MDHIWVCQNQFWPNISVFHANSCAQGEKMYAYKWFKRYIARNLKVLNGYSYQVFQVFSQTAT